MIKLKSKQIDFKYFEIEEHLAQVTKFDVDFYLRIEAVKNELRFTPVIKSVMIEAETYENVETAVDYDKYDVAHKSSVPLVRKYNENDFTAELEIESSSINPAIMELAVDVDIEGKKILFTLLTP